MADPLESSLWAPLSDDQLRVWRVFFRMRRALDRGLDRQLRIRGLLSMGDCEVLRPLMEAPGLSLRSGELADFLEWEVSRLSHHLRRMEARGLISRTASRHDGRGSVVTATSEAVSQFRAVWPSHTEWVKSLFFDGLDEQDLAVLEGVATRVLERLHSEGAVPDPGS